MAATRPNKAERQQRLRKPEAETSAPKRLAAAKREYAALQEWKASGSGERPDTPNFDALPAGSKERKAVTGTESGRPSTLGPRGLQGQAASKKAGRRRGTGNQRLTDDELVAYCAKVQRTHRNSSAVDEFYYARWVEKIAGGRRRFMEAWEEAAGGKKMTRTERAPRKATTAKKVESRKVTKKQPAKRKAAGTKKATTKKAAPARTVAAFRKTTGKRAAARRGARRR